MSTTEPRNIDRDTSGTSSSGSSAAPASAPKPKTSWLAVIKKFFFG